MNRAEGFSPEHRDLLFELSLLISERRGVDEIYAAFADHIRLGITFTFTSLFVVTDDPDYVRSVGHYPYSHEPTAAGTLHRAAFLATDRVVQDTEGSEFIPRYVDLESAQEMARTGLERAWITPLLVDGTNYGLLTVAKSTKGPFPEDHLRFLRAAATLLAKAVRQDLELERARLVAERAGAAQELIFALHAGESFERIFERIPKLLEGALQVDYAGLVVLRGERFTMAAESPAMYATDSPSAAGTAVFRSIAEGHTFVQMRPDTTAQGLPLFQGGYGRAGLAFLRNERELQGALLLARRNARKFDKNEQGFISVLQSILSQSLANQRKAEEKESETRRRQVLSDLAVVLQRGEDIAADFDGFRSLLASALDFDFISLSTLDHTSGEYRCLLSQELFDEHGPLEFDPGAVDRIAASGAKSSQYATCENPQRAPQAMARGGLQRGATAIVAGVEGAEGLLSLGRKEDLPFTAEEMTFLELVCALLGQAATNLQKSAVTAAQALRNRILSELGLLLNNGEPIETHFQKLRELLLEGVGFDFCAVSVREPGQSTLRSMRSQTLPGESTEEPPLETSAVEGVLASGGFSVQFRPDPNDIGPRASLARLGMARAAAFVLTTGGEPEGLLSVARRSETRFTSEEMQFFEVVSSLLAHAALNERRLAETIAEAEDQALIAETAAAVARETNVPAIARSLRATFRFLPSPFVNFGFLDESSVTFPAPDGPDIVLPIGEDFRRTLAEGQVTVTRTAIRSGSPQAQVEVDRIGMQSHILTRALSAGEPVGILVVGSRDPAFVPTARESRLCLLIADIVGPAMANARLAEQQRREAEDQAIIAEAAAAVARETDALKIIRNLQATFRFIPSPFLTFGFLDDSAMLFPRKDGSELRLPIGPNFDIALNQGQHSVLEGQMVSGTPESHEEMLRTGMHSHILTRASSAGSTVGLLVVGSRDPAYLPSPREERVCRLIADILGPAMANARAAEQERRAAEDQAILAEAAAAVAMGNDPWETANSIRSAVARFMPKPFIRFAFLEGDELVFHLPDGRKDIQPTGKYFAQALAAGQAIVPALKVRESAGERVTRTRAARLESHVLTRAESAGTVVGVLLVGTRDPDFMPTTRTLNLCERVAEIIGPAMANARAAEREREEAEDQAIIAEAAAAAARESTPLAIVRGLRAAVGRFIPSPFVNFGFLEGEFVRFPRRIPGEELLHVEHYFSRAFAEGQVTVPSTTARVANGETLDGMLAIGIEAHVLTRASSAGEVTGLLVVGSRDKDFEPGPRQMKLCRLIADIVGPAMANARAAERSRAEAEEQRLIAEVAAVAAREAEPANLVTALRKPLATIVPSPIVAFGYLEGEEVSFPRSDGSVFRVPLDAQALATVAAGQVAWPTPPPALDDHQETRSLGFKSVTSTAVQSGGSLVGFLLIGSRAEGYVVGDRELRIFRLIAQILGPAMENARTTLQARLDAEEQRLLAETARAVASAGGETELRRALARQIAGFVPEPVVALFYRDGNERVRVVSGESGLEGNFEIGGHSAKALESGQAVAEITDDDVRPTTRDLVEPLGVKRWVSTVAISAGETVGLMVVGTRKEDHFFSDRDMRLCRLIADFVGNAMANLREIARRQEEAEEQSILAEAAAAIAAANDEQTLARGLRGPISRFVSQAWTLLFYRDAEQVSIFGANQSVPIGAQMARAFAGEQFCGEMVEGEMVESSREELIRYGVVRFADTPVISAGGVLGILFVGTRDAAYHFSERELRLLSIIAGFAGPAMVNLRESKRRREEAEDQRILAEAAAAIAAGATEPEILRGLYRPIRSFVPNAYVAFSYVDGVEIMLWDGTHRRPIHEFTRQVLRDGQAVGDIETAPMTEASRNLIASAGIRRFVDTAASSAGAQIGLLFVGSPNPQFEFSERAKRLLRLLANAVGPAMANAREARRRDDAAADERIISEIAAIAARATSSAEVIEAIPAALGEFVPEAFCLYGYVESETIIYQITRPEIRDLVAADELSLPMTSVGRTARDFGQGVGSLASVDPGRVYAPLGLQAYSLTTYYVAGSPAGVLLVSSKDPDFEFSERVLVLLRRIVQVVGPAVEASRAEAELARQGQLYGLMLRSLSEGIILLDGEGQVMFSNALGQAITRTIDPGESARNSEEVIALVPDNVRDAFRSVIQDGVGSRGRGPLILNGEERWLDYEFVPLADPVMKALVVVADVTADVEREAEQAQHREQMEQASRLAALGELIGGVAHELNNPLTAILGFAEVMSLSPAAASLTEELSIVQKEALRARNIVRDLLFIVKPGATERATIPVTELVAHIERLRRTSWKQHGIRWDINIEQPCTVWGNEQQLTQVILNLVTNAEHALAGRDDARISIRAVQRGGHTEISVSDTGIGMDEATRLRVFEPFFTTKQGLGTGLGLPLSYSIVQAHNGEFRVESQEGAGTTFTMVLPSAPDVPVAAPPSEEPARPDSISVLVVDDEPSLRKVCQRLIASMGHECKTAENSAEAEELASGADFDVVLCDYRLGSETADDVVAAFERVAPKLIDRMVIATGATTDAGVVELKEKYNLRLMAKPYGVAELNEMISRVTLRAS
ncbi:MAG: GAF domain-containing protein [Dehalococcoidia bacterium]